MDILIIGIISYLIGSIPFGLILTKIFLKKNIRKIGSGNIGATNVLRTGNKVVGYSTLILDILKAIIPVIYVKFNFPDFLYSRWADSIEYWLFKIFFWVPFELLIKMI